VFDGPAIGCCAIESIQALPILQLSNTAIKHISIMKRALKILGIVFGLVVFLVVIGAAAIHFGGIPKYEVGPPEITVTADSNMIAEGKRLATMVCNQ